MCHLISTLYVVDVERGFAAISSAIPLVGKNTNLLKPQARRTYQAKCQFLQRMRQVDEN
jgi:hypothetical protein